MAYSYESHYFKGFEEGKGLQSVGRTAIEAGFMMHFALLGNWTELHTNSEYAEDTQSDQRIVYGLVMFVQSISLVYRPGIVERTAIVLLGTNYMDLSNPMFIGDTLLQVMVVSERKDLGSHDGVGLVILEAEMTKQDGTVVLEGDIKFFTRTKLAAK